MTTIVKYGHRVDISKALAKLLLDGAALPRPGYMKPAPCGPFVCAASHTPKGERTEYFIRVDSHTEHATGRIDDWTGMERGEFLRRLKEAAEEQAARDAYPKAADYVD